MLKKVVFTRGLPGSGKSTYAYELKEKHHDSCFIYSTDDYWLRPDGEYDFNFELLGKSHAWNQRRADETMEDLMDGAYDTIIVIDNTNTTFKEMLPYIKSALQCGYDIEFVEPDTEWRYDVEECFKRNSHGVPYATILKMHQRWETNAEVTRKLGKLK
jgi:predicted kinase